MDSKVNHSFFLKVLLKEVASDNEELVSMELFDLGAFGVSQDLKFIQESQQYDPEILSQESVDLMAFFNVDKKDKIEKSNLTKDYKCEITVEKNKDWLKEWKKHFSAFEVFENLWIVPSWEKETFEKADKSKTIFIEPGLAFGTGTHATTKLCLKALSDLLNKDTNISNALDLGSGSSVLSIYLKKRGVAKVQACEIDPLARENGQFNLSLNEINDVQVLAPEDKALNGEFDLVVANIIDGVLLKLKESIFLKDPKHIVLSGILRENEERLVKAFSEETGYKLVSRDHLEEWSLVTLEKIKE